MNKIVVVFLSLFLLSACSSSPRLIEETQLEQIVSEALITDAVLNSRGQSLSDKDTVDYYTPILERYGYTLADLRFTFAEMASRNSNPLSNLFDKIAKGMDSTAAIAMQKYQFKMRFDTLALSFSADTVYRLDTTLVGNLAKQKIYVAKPQVGDYTLTADYRTHDDYLMGLKSIKVLLGAGKDTTLKRSETIWWLNRTYQKQELLNQKLTVAQQGYDTLMLSFVEPKNTRQTKLPADTSYIKDIMVVYTLPVDSARKVYYYHLADFLEPSSAKYERKFFSSDSLPAPFGRPKLTVD